MRHLSRIFMKEGATRVNFSIPLQLARWQTTLETSLGPFCISNDPVGSIVALMLLRKTFRIIGKKKCSSSGSSHFLANYQSSRTKGETMEEDKSILSKTNSTRNENVERELHIIEVDLGSMIQRFCNSSTVLFGNPILYLFAHSRKLL